MKINGLNLSVDPNSAPYKFLSKAFILRYEKFSLMKFNVQRAIKYCVLVFYIQSCLYFKRQSFVQMFNKVLIRLHPWRCTQRRGDIASLNGETDFNHFKQQNLNDFYILIVTNFNCIPHLLPLTVFLEKESRPKWVPGPLNGPNLQWLKSLGSLTAFRSIRPTLLAITS